MQLQSLALTACPVHRTCCDLNTLRLEVLGVARRLAVQLPELFAVLNLRAASVQRKLDLSD